MNLTNHMKDMISRGFVLKTDCLSVNNTGTIGFYFEKEQKLIKIGRSVGVDIGRNKVITCSDGKLSRCFWFAAFLSDFIWEWRDRWI